MSDQYHGPTAWGQPTATIGERQARIEVVVDHLTAAQRETAARVSHQGEAMSRIFARLDRTDHIVMPMRDALSKLEDLPAKVRAQEDAATRRREAKEENRALRREAIAMVQWLMTIAAVLGVLAGKIAPEAFKAIAPALVQGK